MDKEWTEKLKDIMATFEEKEPSGLWYDIMKALPDGDIANAMHTNSGEKTFEKSSDRTSRRNAIYPHRLRRCCCNSHSYVPYRQNDKYHRQWNNNRKAQPCHED